MPKIKKFFECLIPITACNFKCDYCYVIQREQNKQNIPKLNYSPEIMGKALTQERLGGVCYFSICGAGETFIPDYLIDIIYQLLKNGHYVNITTNGTLTKRMSRLSTLPKDFLKRLHLSFSFHYLELKRLNLMDAFFNNIRFVRSLGCSFVIQLNLYDGYEPYLEDIKSICLREVGALPQIVATRKEQSLTDKIEFMTSRNEESYSEVGKQFESPLFDFTIKNFNMKRHEFCYAGSWSYVLNLNNGILKRCYASCIHQNIFENIDKPLINLPVGNHCGSLFCLNSSHFMSLGVIPEISTPTYSQLRDRPSAKWFNDEVRMFLSGKLEESNKKSTNYKRILFNIISVIDKKTYLCYQKVKKIKKGIQ